MTLVVRALGDQLAPLPDRLINGLMTAGIWTPLSSFQVTAPGGMFVRVGSGTPGDRAVVAGSVARQGTYIVENPDGFYDPGGGGDVPIAEGDPSNDRIDLVVLRVLDDAMDSSGQTRGIVDVVEGTPASSPSPPAVPDSAIALAEVLVAAGESTAIVGGDITDRRVQMRVRGAPGADPVDDDDLARRRWIEDYVDAQTHEETQTLAAPAASIDFTVPGGFQDLEVTVQGKHGGTGYAALLVRFNDDETSGNYRASYGWIDQAGTSGAASTTTSIGVGQLSEFDGCQGTIWVPAYAASGPGRRGAHSRVWAQRAAGDQRNFGGGGWWNSSDAVTKVTLLLSGVSFAAGTVATLRAT